MASKKNASKESKKVSFDFSIDSKTSKSSKKKVKKLTKGVVGIVIVFLILGLAVGGGLTYYMTRNDCFELIGADELTLTTAESYVDEGVKVISFGRDLTDKVHVRTNLVKDAYGNYIPETDADGEISVGTYYIVYTVDCLKYGSIFKIEKVRLITFVEPSDDDNLDEELSSVTNGIVSNSEVGNG